MTFVFGGETSTYIVFLLSLEEMEPASLPKAIFGKNLDWGKNSFDMPFRNSSQVANEQTIEFWQRHERSRSLKHSRGYWPGRRPHP